ncbi:hypothetical protein IQ241_22960 [Romeria aff. gracilis LEGE 07310]|uniref:Uncharacterized protein n=1 Tax=Vasconcelosia minhoensis LEGE 07310 TaxID=915328 RepID=A0A8J7A9Y3_9CYAN|nr:hypothetical protein [Romeria gracilis]MBE9080117.1 hypothetical protein [Romeria aff. gracilis LEGE 07310]
MNSLTSAPLDRYADALKTVETAEQPQPEAVLALLLALDELQVELATGQLPQAHLLQVVELDERLRGQRDRVAQALPLADWRTSLNIADSAWWWQLEPPPHRLDRFDWVWNALTVTSLTASASLVVEISSKFLVVTPGLLGSVAVVGQIAQTHRDWQ